MRFARSLLAGAFFATYGAFALLFAPLLVLPVWTPRAFRAVIRLFYRAFVLCARVTGLFAVEVAPDDRARLAACRGCVVVANHVSLIDIVILLSQLGDATAIAKASVRRNPFLALVATKMFLINDMDPRALIEDARRLLARGVNIVVFPQGTRGGRTLHRGAARIALETGVAVQPVTLAYDPPVLAKGQRWWDVGARTIRIRLKALAPVAATLSVSRAAACDLTARLENLLLPHPGCPDLTP